MIVPADFLKSLVPGDLVAATVSSSASFISAADGKPLTLETLELALRFKPTLNEPEVK